MSSALHARDFHQAELAVVSLLLEVTQARVARHHFDITPPHKGKAYQSKALRFANKSNELEKDYAPQIHAVAAEITAICSDDWHEDRNILKLWHDLAETVMQFSEHPSKKVATLIINDEAELQAFAANRVPDNVPQRGKHYREGIRKEFIVCSERIALARLLGIEIDRPNLDSFKPKGRRRDQRQAIGSLTTDITKAAQNGRRLRDSFMLTTTSPCETCAHAIAPFHPRAIITASNAGRHFKRAEGMAMARLYLLNQNVPFISLI